MKVESEGDSLYRWDGFAVVRFISRSGSDVFERRGDSDRLLLDLAAGVGSSWTLALVDSSGDVLDGTKFRVLDRNDVLHLTAGTFAGCLYLAAVPSPSLADAGLLELWLTPNVGVVRWVEQTIAGPQTYSLLSYRIFGAPTLSALRHRVSRTEGGARY